MVTDASGTKVAEMGHFPYGESWYNATSDKLIFTTYERDSESGNDYAQARYHVSGLGRFSSPDPIAGSTSDPQSFNRYSYVRNMPVMLSDPSGLIPSCTTLDNRSPEFFSSGPTWGGGPSDASLSSEAEALPPSGCGGPPPCQYTFAGCGGGFGGDDGGDGGAGLGGLFPGDGGGGFGGAGSGLGDFGPFGFFGGGDPSGGGGWGPGFGADLLYGPLPDCFPFFSDGAGFSVMAGNCGSQSGSSGGGNSSGDPVGATLKKLQKLLKLDPHCSSFLSGNGTNAQTELGGIIDNHLYGQTEIPPTPTGPGTLSMTNAVSFGYIPGQAITVNTIGAFFNSTYNNLPLTTDRGKIAGGTPAAQGFILLHELGHLTDVLKPDFNNQKVVDQNDKALEGHCKDLIKALSR